LKKGNKGSLAYPIKINVCMPALKLENFLGRHQLVCTTFRAIEKAMIHVSGKNKRHKTEAAKQSALPSDCFILA
jgi:hypothetical protein